MTIKYFVGRASSSLPLTGRVGAQPQSDVSDFGRIRINEWPNSSKPGFGCAPGWGDTLSGRFVLLGDAAPHPARTADAVLATLPARGRDVFRRGCR